MAVTASQANLAGLPRRLVQDGLITEDQLLEATEAARKEKVPLVAYLVNAELADARAIAVAASHEFGVPLLDLDAIDIDLDVVRDWHGNVSLLDEDEFVEHQESLAYPDWLVDSARASAAEIVLAAERLTEPFGEAAGPWLVAMNQL